MQIPLKPYLSFFDQLTSTNSGFKSSQYKFQFLENKMENIKQFKLLDVFLKFVNSKLYEKHSIILETSFYKIASFVMKKNIQVFV